MHRELAATPRLMNLMTRRVATCLRDRRDQGLVENAPTRGGQWLEWQISAQPLLSDSSALAPARPYRVQLSTVSCTKALENRAFHVIVKQRLFGYLSQSARVAEW